MQQETNLLELVSSCCFGCPNISSIYTLSSDSVLILTFLSFIISTILHRFFNKTDFKTSNNSQIEIIEVKKSSFITKTIVVFFILILVSMPIFKLLNTGYFL